MAQRRGISNVVATIILIAVAIALAVAVAIWVFGIFKGSAHATTLKHNKRGPVHYKQWHPIPNTLRQ